MIILYAEDDPEDVEVFREAIKAIDTTIGCIIARDGNEALEILHSAIILPDYIFLDINMPMLSGRDCLVRIRNNKQFKDIPVIMYTTSNRNQDIVECRKLGANDYIIKPNTFSEVFGFLSAIVRKAS
jgi:CheY-like chemotaxis protein